MKKFLIFVGLLAFSVGMAQSPSYPRDVTLCWDHPTEYELLPGQTIPSLIQPGDLRGTKLTGTRNDGTVVVDQEVAIGSALPGDNQCFLFSGSIPQPGTYSFFAFAVVDDTSISDASNESIKKYTGKPKPAQGLGAQ